MTSLEKAALDWYHARRDWMEFATFRANYAKADRDRICDRMGETETTLEAEAAKLKDGAEPLLTWDQLHDLVEECSDHIKDHDARDALLARLVEKDPRPSVPFKKSVRTA